MAKQKASISNAFNAYADMTKALNALRDVPGSKFCFHVVKEDPEKGEFVMETNLTYVDGWGVKDWGDKTRPVKVSISPGFEITDVSVDGEVLDGNSSDERLQSAIQGVARNAKIQHLVP